MFMFRLLRTATDLRTMQMKKKYFKTWETNYFEDSKPFVGENKINQMSRLPSVACSTFLSVMRIRLEFELRV